MKIEFYEEFPTEENLQKLKLIKYPIRLFVAAKSIEEFLDLEKKVKTIKRDTNVAYWPIVKNSYWISPFSNKEDLIETFKELENIDNQLLIDLEMPRNKKLVKKNLSPYFENRKLIKNFLEKNKKRITTAEFPVSIISPLMKLLGLDYNIETEKSLMWYSSMNSELMNKNIKKNLLNLKNKENYSVGLGTIATGILRNEPILSPKNLEKDLKFVKECGFKRVVIFRFGGINKEYVKVLEKFT